MKGMFAVVVEAELATAELSRVAPAIITETEVKLALAELTVLAVDTEVVLVAAEAAVVLTVNTDVEAGLGMAELSRATLEVAGTGECVWVGQVGGAGPMISIFLRGLITCYT